MTGCDWAGCSAQAADPSAWCVGHRPTGWTADDFFPFGEARVVRYDSGVIASIEWPSRQMPRPNRGPSVLRFIDSGALKTARWIRRRKRTRTDGPAEVVVSRGGWVENYYLDGVRHRDGGPASISFFPDGSVKADFYLVRDRMHRVGGPYQTHYREDGSVADQWFAVEGIRLSAGEFAAYREAMADGSPHEWAIAFAFGDQAS